MIPGSATGANHEVDIADAALFVVEVAKQVGRGACQVVDVTTFERLRNRYIDLNVFRTMG